MSGASIAALRARHHDFQPHSDHVCRLATKLFIGLCETHRVSPVYLPILQAGALLHNVGLAEDPAGHHTHGRDIVVSEGLRGFDAEQRGMVACIVGFHRKRVEPEKEPLWRALAADHQGITIRLAALLRVADGLDDSYDQTTDITRIGAMDRTVRVSGDRKRAQSDAKRARKKADLWGEYFGHDLNIEYGKAGRWRWYPPVRPDQTVRESAGVVLRGYLAHVVAEVSGVGRFDGIDPRHDMRVGLRRYRSALRTYRPVWNPDVYAQFVEELRWFGGLLGAVRDLDVTVAWFDTVLADCPGPVRDAFTEVRRENLRERRMRHRDLVSGLRSEHFSAVLSRASEWALTPDSVIADGNGNGGRQVGDAIRRVVRRRARRIRAYEGTLEESETERLHALRIECRKMRYAAEAWYGALGPGRQSLVENLTTVQDALGDVHDADVRLANWPDASDKPEAVWLHDRLAADRARAWKVFRKSWPELLTVLTKKNVRRLTDTR